MLNQRILSILACTLLIGSFGAQAVAQNSDSENEPQVEDLVAESKQLVLDAAASVESLRARERFAKLLPKARAIAIFPQVVKGGLIIGAQTGLGVLTVKNPDGSWSAPAFYSISALSIGLQAGAEVSTIGLAVMNENALQAFFDGGFELGGGIDLTVATLGGTADLDTAADIITFTAASGAFAGVSIEGSNFSAEKGRNAAYYGRELTTREVVTDVALTSPEAKTLSVALNSK